jgi:hypothetical protein
MLGIVELLKVCVVVRGDSVELEGTWDLKCLVGQREIPSGSIESPALPVGLGFGRCSAPVPTNSLRLKLSHAGLKIQISNKNCDYIHMLDV